MIHGVSSFLVALISPFHLRIASEDVILFSAEQAKAVMRHGELLLAARPYPSSVRSGETNRGRLIETMPGRAFIFFVTFVKQDDMPGFEPDLTEEGYSGWQKD